MSRRLLIVLTLALLGLMTLAASPAVAGHKANRWTSLGELHVTDRVDRDSLRIGGKQGTFDSIRLKIKGHAVQFHSLEIHFENDAVQKVSLRSVIKAGKTSRVIDLEGGQRAIEKIVFVYDAQTLRPGKGARVHVYGRR